MTYLSEKLKNTLFKSYQNPHANNALKISD